MVVFSAIKNFYAAVSMPKMRYAAERRFFGLLLIEVTDISTSPLPQNKP